MMRKLAAALAAAAVVLLATASWGQTPVGRTALPLVCYPADDLVAAFKAQDGAKRAMGADRNGGKFELWSLARDGWVVVLLLPNRNLLCAVLEGDGLDLAPAAPGVEG